MTAVAVMADAMVNVMASGVVTATPKVALQGVATTGVKAAALALKAIRKQAVKADARAVVVAAVVVAAAVVAADVAKAKVKAKATASVLTPKASHTAQTSVCKLLAHKTLAATNSALNARPVASVPSAMTVVTEATAQRVTASAAKAPSAHRKYATT